MIFIKDVYKSTAKHIVLIVMILNIVSCATVKNKEIENSIQDSLELQLTQDEISLIAYNDGFKSIMDYISSHSELFSSGDSKNDLPSHSQRNEIQLIWKSALDYIFALDRLQFKYQKFYLIDSAQFKKRAFVVYYAAFLIQYRFAMDFIKIMETNPGFDTLLNESREDIRVTYGMYDDIKYRFLNLKQGTLFVSLNTIYSFYNYTPPNPIKTYIVQHKQQIWDMGKGEGELLTLENGLNMVKTFGKKAIFPMQTDISRWMGDVKIRRINESLITKTQLESISSALEPGDIMLQRREWYLSNIGLPGFWPHAALFVGRPEQRLAFFNDHEVNLWVKSKGIDSGSFEDLLENTYPQAYAAHLQLHDDGHYSQVLEAMSEGVVFTTIEHSAYADSLAVLRARLTKLELAQGIFRAFSYHNRPYDFDFDFLTDNTLVCTELVYKSFLPDKDYKGLHLPLTTMMGRLVTPANDIARLFDQEYGKNEQQLDLVMFYDGNEFKRKATKSDLETFRNSWKRPKWFLFTQ